MRPLQLTRLLVVAAVSSLIALPVAGQDGNPSTQSTPAPAEHVAPPPAPQPNPPAPQDQSSVPPSQRTEKDETIVNLPTTLPLQRHHSYFRLTHRFARDLGRGTFSDLAQDLFSLDDGAVIGLEYRYGITSRIQAGIHRTIFAKEMNVFGRYDAIEQGDRSPLAVSVGAGYEGDDNLRRDHQPWLSATGSRTLGSWLALYVTPTWVHHAHTDTLLAEHAGHASIPGSNANDASNPARDTWFVGVGSRVRIRPTAFLVTEISPRVRGYIPDTATWAVGIEKQTRGHMFQLNFGNSFDTTPGLIARGGNRNQVFMGFNISRRF